ncbi:MAG: polysaccharide biosynthesis tyrosine autokinase [Phycisphaerales bacterium]|jgi:capsular exopolysaccharide synthesis family protein
MPSAMAPAASSQGPGITIDPVKLLLRYKWYLIAALVIGAVVGVISNYVLAQVAPRWSSQVIFECKPQTQTIAEIAGTGQAEEMQRFMLTQISTIRQDLVLQKVVEDSGVLTKRAPKWSSQFMGGGGQGGDAFDTVGALKALRRIVSASVISGTNLLQVSVTYSDKWEATELVGMVKEKYMDSLAARGKAGLDDKIDGLNNQINRFESEIKILSGKRQALIQSKGLDSVDDRQSNTKFELSQVTDKRLTVAQSLEAQRTSLSQMEAEYSSPGGIVYSAELRATADRDPQILELHSDIQRVTSAIEARKISGMMPTHREMVQLTNQLDGLNATLDEKEKEVLKKLFEAQLDSTRKSIAQYEAIEKSLVDQTTALQDKLVDLSKAQQELNDYKEQISGLAESKRVSKQEMEGLISQKGSVDVNRVILVQDQRAPIEMSFPQLKILLPAGAVVLLGLTAGVIVLIELLDTRVKSPSDVAIMPRVRLIGWVPDGGEDPAGQGAIETAFRERPRGVVAESFRQIRGSIAKRLHSSGHRTVLVASGMPQSGATSVAANLALSFASADKRVLLIDANFRRPALHRVFSAQETPGLADVLAAKPDERAQRLAEVTQATTTPSLDLLTAGTKDQRVFERLATDAMSEVLASVKAMYDVIIVDVAPVVVSGDALALANRCDCSVLVVRALADKRGMVARIKNEMSEARGEFLGIIVNAVKSSSGGYMKRNIQTAHEYQNP